MTESVRTGMMLFRRFNVTIVKGCSVVDGEMYEQACERRLTGTSGVLTVYSLKRRH